MAQFRVELVLDEASGMYLAELYHPENENELVVRTEARYPTQAAALLGVVQIFKDAMVGFPKKGRKKKATKRHAARGTSARRKPRKRARR
ncbi:MAG TPA: hypothetical protein VF211_06815 [Burkholderiales bacterium]